ncbi:hypothetical protein V7S43_008747 [Phytophthora oleae]|uniref:Uncharacterized protein n=1 Tax=Phytophthora oleae TaxID=2107226 RepID=A0ABD3FGQ1_9STRA
MLWVLVLVVEFWSYRSTYRGAAGRVLRRGPCAAAGCGVLLVWVLVLLLAFVVLLVWGLVFAMEFWCSGGVPELLELALVSGATGWIPVILVESFCVWTLGVQQDEKEAAAT